LDCEEDLDVKLAVSTWRPYQHQATALQQLIGEPLFELVDLDSVPGGLVDAAFGPFLALVEGNSSLPLVGLPAIVEALDRKYPTRGLLPEAPLERAAVRQLAAKIEECFVRITVAGIASHENFGRRIWHADSDARAVILDDYPKRIATLEAFQRGSTSRFLVGDRPTLADCLLAALWWTAEDQGLASTLVEQPHLKRWHAACCAGDPFRRRT
jgi:glutathione S-transferase